jgi:glycosyltransferase involved in cell wall biosynthesis
MHLLFLTAEQWPTYRTDITVLFGKYLPRLGITCDLLTEQDAQNQTTAWFAGKAILCKVPNNRAGQYIVKFFHQAKVLITTDYTKYQAVQIRDLTVIALLALIICRIKKRPFFYWLSYPQSEGQVRRAKARGFKGGFRYWFPLIQGVVGQFLLYKLILPNTNHIFVQSQNMLEMLQQRGIAKVKMTPVPMGVDVEVADQKPVPSDNPALNGKRVLVYLGTLDRVRNIEILFSMLAIIQKTVPNVLLVLAGDTEDDSHRAWLKNEAERLNVMQHIFWTGWLPMTEAWGYVTAAEIGLSPFPRGFLLDMASPTKAIEYMALGLPMVVNDNPDQAQVVQESHAGLCVALNPDSFAEAVIYLLNNANQCKEMAQCGREYILKNRGYDSISHRLSEKYMQLIIN